MEMFILIFACFCILCAILYRFTFGLRKDPGQTRETQLVMLALIGFGMCLIGGVETTEILLSKRLTVEGKVVHYRITSGRGRHSSFRVQDPEGNSVWLSASYIGPYLYEGQHVRATYLDRTSDVTRLENLDGPNVGWSETETAGIVPSLFALGGGVVLLWAATRVSKNRASPQETQSANLA